MENRNCHNEQLEVIWLFSAGIIASCATPGISLLLAYCPPQLYYQVNAFLTQRQPWSWVQPPSFPALLESAIATKISVLCSLLNYAYWMKSPGLTCPYLKKRWETPFPSKSALQVAWALKKPFDPSPGAQKLHPCMHTAACLFVLITPTSQWSPPDLLTLSMAP